MKTAAILLAVSACVALVAAAAAAPAMANVVHTEYGDVEGLATDTYRAWLGIPYAASTGGANRFMPPKAREPWTGVRNAMNFGPGCVQSHHNADVPKNQSEDCLNLNVFAPAWANASSNLPVMIFFHGGAFVEGSNQGPFHMYDAGYMVSQAPVIAVTSNYRLGGFGWLVTDSVKGNQGLRDQIMALQWLQDNIAAFGGDKSQVTLWGESAGAMSGGIHLVSPASKGLFNKVIMESNPSGFRYRDEAEQADYGSDFCTTLKCMVGTTCNTTCIQQASTKDVMHAWGKAGNDYFAIAEANWGHWLDAFLMCTPTVDGDILPYTPMQALDQGLIMNNVSILIGTNNNEGSTFIYAALEKALPTYLYQIAMGVIFEKDGKEILNYYKNITGGETADSRTVLSRVITDYWFRCASERFATLAVTKGGAQAYVYRFDHIFSDRTLFTHFGLPAICSNRTCHGSELPFVFHFTHLETPAVNFTMTPVEQQLSQSFVEYWTSFAIHGNPNTGNKQPVSWPAWDPTTRPNIILQDSIATENTVALCSFWDGVKYNH